jgi:hypothetical protein
VRKQDAEHGKPRGVIARLDQVAHLLAGPWEGLEADRPEALCDLRVAQCALELGLRCDELRHETSSLPLLIHAEDSSHAPLLREEPFELTLSRRTQLRDRKLGHLAPQDDETVISANIGCIQHLQSGTATPVRHWVEVLDDALNRG